MFPAIVLIWILLSVEFCACHPGETNDTISKGADIPVVDFDDIYVTDDQYSVNNKEYAVIHGYPETRFKRAPNPLVGSLISTGLSTVIPFIGEIGQIIKFVKGVFSGLGTSRDEVRERLTLKAGDRMDVHSDALNFIQTFLQGEAHATQKTQAGDVKALKEGQQKLQVTLDIIKEEAKQIVQLLTDAEKRKIEATMQQEVVKKMEEQIQLQKQIVDLGKIEAANRIQLLIVSSVTASFIGIMTIVKVLNFINCRRYSIRQ